MRTREVSHKSNVVRFKAAGKSTRIRHYHVRFHCIDCGYPLKNPHAYLCHKCKSGKALFLAMNDYMRIEEWTA